MISRRPSDVAPLARSTMTSLLYIEMPTTLPLANRRWARTSGGRSPTASAAVVLVIHRERSTSCVAIAAFFAVVLTGPVNFLERRLHFRRALAALVVFLIGFLVFAGMIYSFVRPLVDQGNHFINNFPS